MWKALGFSASPYDQRPLAPEPDDAELLVGRGDEATALYTTVESDSQGVMVISGPPGVGKTSFFNVQQYLLESGEAPFGPKLLAARQLAAMYPKDSARAIALRVAQSLHRSVETYCSVNKLKVPKQTREIGKWLSSKGNSGFSIGLDILGFGGSFGRETELPSVADASFESFSDVIACMVAEIVAETDLEGAFIGLDNVENLTDEELGDLLITFRDTLFVIPGVWWVLVGQSGLGSLLQTLDPRVADRLSGSGLELEPISVDELNEAISRRVRRFRSSTKGRAPLPRSTHDALFKASHGEIRFVFRYSNAICTHFVTDIRTDLAALAGKELESHFDKAIGQALAEGFIPEGAARKILREITKKEIDGLHLKPKEKAVLGRICERGEARAKDHAEVGLHTSMQDFSSNYLSKFHRQNLLARRQEGRAAYYRPRGMLALAGDFGLLK